MPDYRIRDVADLLGVSDDTARRWTDSGALPSSKDASGRTVVDGAALAAFAVENAATAATDTTSVARSARNRFAGLVTRVVADGVMAQVEMQCGPTPRRLPHERRGRRRTRPGTRQPRDRGRQGHHRHRRDPGRPLVRFRALPGLLVVALLTACGAGGGSAADATSSSPAERTLTVFAAASLKGTFTRIGTEFEAANPGVRVTFSFAGSSDLATQIGEGLPRTSSPRPTRRTWRRSRASP